ncbi:MAG: hypothetical protein WAN92_04855 [Herbaspirillum sp.]
MSNMHKCIHGLAILSLSILCIPQASAFGGTAYFVGSIVEPACFVNTQHIAPVTPATPRSTHRIPLNVHCNAGQSVQISVQSTDTTIDNNMLSNSARENIVISRHASSTDHGSTVNYQLGRKKDSGKKEMVIPLTAILRKADNTDTTQMSGNVLVSFNYH